MRKVKQKSAVLLTVMLLFGIGFIGCKDENDDTPVLSQQDQTFTKNLAAANVAEIQLGQLALQRAANDSIKAFAQMMITDHNKALKQLDSISKGLNVVLSDSLDSSHKALYNRLSGLSNAATFDSLYISNQVLDHQNTLNLLQNEVNYTSGNQRLVDYARKQVPIVTRHLSEATRLRNKINSGNNTPGTTPGGSTPGGK